MKTRASSYRKTANVFLSVVLVLGLAPVPAFATGDAADEAATAPTPPIASEPLTASAALGVAAGSSANLAAPSASDPVDALAALSASALAPAPAPAVPATEPAAAIPADATLTPGWTQSGTCEWMIDSTGKLTIRPLGNGASGSLGALSGYAPWYDQRASITSVVVESGVSTNWCQHMFRECENLVTADLSGLNTQNAEGMSYMFFGCKSLKSVNLSGVDTSNVKAMALMFGVCPSLESLDLSGFDTSQVTSMLGMFNGASALTSLDLSSFDTSKVTTMRIMFSECAALTSVNVSSFNTANVTDMHGMFSVCDSLETLDVSNFVLSASTNTSYFFSNSPKLSQLTLAAGQNFTNSNLREASWMDTAGNLYDWSYVMLGANRDRASGVETYVIPQPTEGWTRVGTCEWMIDAAGKLTVRPLGNGASGKMDCDLGGTLGGAPWSSQSESITSAVFEPGVSTNWAAYMFSGCENLTTVDFSELDTSRVTDMKSMFSS